MTSATHGIGVRADSTSSEAIPLAESVGLTSVSARSGGPPVHRDPVSLKIRHCADSVARLAPCTLRRTVRTASLPRFWGLARGARWGSGVAHRSPARQTPPQNRVCLLGRSQHPGPTFSARSILPSLNSPGRSRAPHRALADSSSRVASRPTGLGDDGLGRTVRRDGPVSQLWTPSQTPRVGGPLPT